MPILDDVNELSHHGIDEFRIDSYDSCRLVIVGSFDLGYYHDVEITFTEVDFIRCATNFMQPMFRDAGVAEDNCRRYEITTDDVTHEIMAESVAINFGKVFYYDRGADLKPGERIADWVQRENT